MTSPMELIFLGIFLIAPSKVYLPKCKFHHGSCSDTCWTKIGSQQHLNFRDSKPRSPTTTLLLTSLLDTAAIYRA
uniref:Secreted protein n=1 Tax=Anguilla anguilla TaxID=7936 RepID=A0A0E9VW20_ANGAN